MILKLKLTNLTFFMKKYYNYYRNHKKIVKIEAKKYQKELDLEIALKGLQEEVIGEKEIIVSNVDKDAGMPYKSGKEKMFGYNTSVICENNNYILTVDTNESNVHDSVFFYDSFDNLNKHFDISLIKYFVEEAAYLTPHICKTVIDLDMIHAFSYTRKRYRKDYLKK